MDNYKNGIYIDSNLSQTTDFNPIQSLKKLNDYSYQGGGLPNCSIDRWVFNKVNCSNTDQVFIPSDETNGTKLTTSNVLCISLQDKFTSDRNHEWTQSQFTQRYLQIRTDCNTQYTRITDYGQALILYRDSH